MLSKWGWHVNDIQELKFYFGKFRQYFGTSVGQFEGLLRQLAPGGENKLQGAY